MKRSVLAFIILVLLVLLAVPAINIMLSANFKVADLKEKSFLYNMNFVSRWTALLLYPLGISTDPKQVIIGKQGWLYLGDSYNKTISDARRTATEKDVLVAKDIAAAADAWSAYLEGKGVKLYRIMIGPNKSAIYPEHMPSWAAPTSFNAADALLAESKAGVYIDLKPSLIAAKETHREDLYYKTDTHWNQSGGGVAFQAFSQQLAKEAPELKWPSVMAYQLKKIDARSGGDLARFLRLQANLVDYEPRINTPSLIVKTQQSEFHTKKVIFTGGNPGVAATNKPVLVTSTGALNTKKVLWLRDSFGNSLSPFMAATFSQVLQIHWRDVMRSGTAFSTLVNDFKPDYVFVTVVERDSRSTQFSSYPPPLFANKNSGFETSQTSVRASANHLVLSDSEDEYSISGVDPYIDFKLTAPSKILDSSHLAFNFVCSDGSASVPIQIFWIDEISQGYSQKYSARLTIPTGQILLDTRTVPKLAQAKMIKRIRIDVDANSYCSSFKITPPELGHILPIR